MPQRVVIIGAGIGGLSTAHELINMQERAGQPGAFSIEIYEASDKIGGKARSQYPVVKLNGADVAAPAEHGFRFCPHFYRHLPDTYKTIPVGPGSYDSVDGIGTVYERLLDLQKAGLADNGTVYGIDRPMPDNWAERMNLFFDTLVPLGFLASDVIGYGLKFGHFAMSCEKRRELQFDRQSWDEFVDAPTYRADFRELIVNGSVNLSAMKATEGSAFTIGTITMQMAFPFRKATQGPVDSPLNAPTDQSLLEPWLAHLVAKGVAFKFGKRLNDLAFGADGSVSEVRFDDNTSVQTTGAGVVMAIPVECMQKLLADHPAIQTRDPHLANIVSLGDTTRDMIGCQFYFKKALNLTFKGHITFPRSTYALTAVPQMQLWHPAKVKEYRDQGIFEVLSVIVSNWQTPAPGGLAAQDQPSTDALLDAVWEQLADGLGTLIDKNDVVFRYLDANVKVGAASGFVNDTPLLIHKPNMRRFRPPCRIGNVPGLFIAADYVKTETDLASMEGANEAARRVVVELGAVVGIAATHHPKLWDFKEDGAVGAFLAPFKAADRALYERGWRHIMAGGDAHEWVSYVAQRLTDAQIVPANVLTPQALAIPPNGPLGTFPQALFKLNAQAQLGTLFGNANETKGVMKALEFGFQARKFPPRSLGLFDHWSHALSQPRPQPFP